MMTASSWYVGGRGVWPPHELQVLGFGILFETWIGGILYRTGVVGLLAPGSSSLSPRFFHKWPVGSGAACLARKEAFFADQSC